MTTDVVAQVVTERPPTGPLALDPERWGARHLFAELPSDVAGALRALPGEIPGNLLGGLLRLAQHEPLLVAGLALLAATALFAFSAPRASRPAGRRAQGGRSRPEGGCPPARAAPR